MSDVALFAGDRFYRSQFNTAQASYTIFQKDGVTYADPGYPGGLPYSGTDAATVINNAIAALTSGGKICIKAGIYTINTKITLCPTGINNIVLEGDSPETVTLQAGGSLTGPLVQTVPTGLSSPLVRGALKNLDLEMGTVAGNALYLAPGTQYFQFENLLIGGGTAASTAIDIEDNATVGTYYNTFRHVHERATATFGTGLTIGNAAGAKNAGPTWFYGGTIVGNAANAIVVGSGPQFFFGTELLQGNAYVNSSVQLKVSTVGGAGYPAQVWFYGDYEVTAGTTTGLQVDSNSQLHLEGHTNLTFAQLLVTGQLYMRSMRVGASNSLVYDNLYSRFADLLNQTTTGGSSNFITWTPLHGGQYEIGGNLLLNSITGGTSIQLSANWTDEQNNGHTIPLVGIDTLGANDANSIGVAGHVLMVKTLCIRVKDNTPINLSVIVNGGPSAINYDASGFIRPSVGAS